MIIEETIQGVCPSKSNCYKIGRNGLYKGTDLTKYEDKFYMQCKNRDALIAKYFEIYIDVFYPSERSDLDNSLKITLDCLQKCKVIKNDNRCTKIVARKFLDKDKPRVEIKIKVVE